MSNTGLGCNGVRRGTGIPLGWGEPTSCHWPGLGPRWLLSDWTVLCGVWWHLGIIVGAAAVFSLGSCCLSVASVPVSPRSLKTSVRDTGQRRWEIFLISSWLIKTREGSLWDGRQASLEVTNVSVTTAAKASVAAEVMSVPAVTLEAWAELRSKSCLIVGFFHSSWCLRKNVISQPREQMQCPFWGHPTPPCQERGDCVGTGLLCTSPDVLINKVGGQVWFQGDTRRSQTFLFAFLFWASGQDG